MEGMSDIISLVRKVACRVVGAESPAIDAIVAAAMADLTTAIREREIAAHEIRSHAKHLAKVKATRAFATERREAAGVGRESSLLVVHLNRVTRCRECLDKLIAELQNQTAAPRAVMSPTAPERGLIAA